MKSILSILCLGCLSIPALATSYTFSGTTGNWNVAGNWTPATIPVAGDDVTIGAGKAVNIPAGYAAAAKSMYINGSLALEATGSLVVTGSTGDGIYIGTAGVLNNLGTINVAAAATSGINLNAATATLNNSGIISITGGTAGIVQFYGTTINSGTMNVDNITINDGVQVNTGTFTNAGTIKIGSNGPVDEGGVAMVGGTFTNNAVLEINNIPNTTIGYDAVINYGGAFINGSTGILTIGASSPVKNGIGNYGVGNGTFSNSGTVNFGSGILLAGIESGMTVNNNAGGIFNIPASGLLKVSGVLNNTGTVTNSATGTLTVNGTLTNNATATVTNNGTLKGSGTITQSGTFTNVSGAHVAPGNSAGTLTVTGNFNLGSATLDAEVNGNTTALYDVLAVSGAVTLTNASLNVIRAAGYTPANTDLITIINAGSLVGTFSSVQPTGFSRRYNYPSTGKFTLGNAVALPVKLLTFSATNATTRNRIDWTTATEDPGTSFEVTRSSNGVSFEKIGEAAGKGHDASYTFYDNQPLNPINYYRLQCTEASGAVTFSNVVVVRNNGGKGSITIAPIPAKNSITICNTSEALTGTTAVVNDMQGREVYRLTLGTTSSINVAAWPAGIYSLRLADGTAVRLVKQ